MLSAQDNIQLNNGLAMPLIGLGVYRCSPEETIRSVQAALAAGYRLIDTATAYGNEEQVGQALRSSGVDPAGVFVTSKLWISDYGYDEALRGYEASLQRLGMERLDLYLLHQPLTAHFERTVAAWRALAELQAQGRVGAIGVSNLDADQIEALIGETGAVPAVNQVELHPFFSQPALRQYHRQRGILSMAWSPIGGVNRYWLDNAQRLGDPLRHPAIVSIAEAHHKSAAQVILRWHLQNGVVPIPKSVNPVRIAENVDLFDLELSPEEMAAIDGLDTGLRGGPDPAMIGA